MDWNLHIEIDRNIYEHYRNYLKDNGIAPAGQYSKIKPITKELIETVLDLIGECQTLDIDKLITDLINKNKKD